MPRFYVPPHAWNATTLALDAAESHHALNVLRLKKGDRAIIFNGQGTEATVEIAGAREHRVELRKL
ncbi:MAG: 16S rRNA (uracil(1498)-N(3))-methyltransferase, partial [Verrucomicrobiota bacterium]|nr:16S rRNA (uracil(1498)-N(3))-methyltransferase [Verrucomicrobiota bacterium]